MGGEPNHRKACAGSKAALRRFFGPDEENNVKLLYSDNCGELSKAARELGIRHDTAIPDKPQTNGVAEAFVERGREWTSCLLTQSGFEYGYSLIVSGGCFMVWVVWLVLVGLGWLGWVGWLVSLGFLGCLGFPKISRIS